MRIRLTKRPLRRNWSSAKGLVLERDISVGHGKLRAKLLVFRHGLALRRFWKMIGSYLPRGTHGVVNGLQAHITQFRDDGTERHLLECDPRYFCIIGLVETRLVPEVIAHESVHAGYCFADRKSRCWWDKEIRSQPEEAVAYPAGKICSAIYRALYDGGLL